MADRLIKPVLDGYPIGWFAPTYKVLDDAWLYLTSVLEPLIKVKNKSAYFIELITGGKIEFWSMDSGLVARSRKYKEVVVDEAAQIGELIYRWEHEIRPTLVDFEGGAWFGSTPDGINDFYDVFNYQDTNPEWKSWQMPSWTNTFLPLKERQEMQHKAEVLLDPAARQEYGAEFVDGTEGFVPSAWVDACALNADWWQPLDPYAPICVGIDVGTKNDLFSITGWGRSQEVLDQAGNVVKPRKYKPAFAKIFHPEDLNVGNGKVSFDKPKEFLRQVARNYRVMVFAYDPYQCQGLADDLWQEGIGEFEEFNQGVKRVLADSFLYTLLRDGEIEWYSHDESFKEMAQHFKNANAKIEGEDKRRLVKRSDQLKIDASVSSSMAIYKLQDYFV